LREPVAITMVAAGSLPFGDLAAEFGDPGSGGFVVHGALLERDVVAVDRGVGLSPA